MFVISQTLFPALLYLPGTQPLRVPLRVAAYGISLVALALWLVSTKRCGRAHPSRRWLLAALAWLALMIFHPTTNTLLAGLGQTMLYLAVFAPVFWAADWVRTPARLRRLLAILLICNGANAAVGILQVYDPGRWLPKEFTTVGLTAQYGALTYIGANGRQIVRPPGFSDAPGGVCGPAACAAVLGVIIGLDAASKMMWRAAALGFAFLGFGAVYLSQVRSSLIVIVASLVAYGGFASLRRDTRKAVALAVVLCSLLFGAFAFAVMFGGEGVSRRISTLFQEDPGTVYYQSRGVQLEHAFNELLVEYPIGAGLGRWGMMRTYFGDESNVNSPPVWAEIQWPAWILDGGVVLVILYAGALVATAAYAFWLTLRGPRAVVREQASTVFAVQIGAMALLFSYTPFVAPIGVQYWFLAGALHGVATRAYDWDRGLT